ncbi:hypothetical protein BDN72DRAFT_885296 [Pluteus cervinus]|uniref:Uncharacterized protein n=1 Tax=Pluteus cervinus TaxID=181527 RepID=A0ACD3BDM5_9AGAR|nr:hypothetical protein BDN72DRAFT_885296 [Pluteus cervinus]
MSTSDDLSLGPPKVLSYLGLPLDYSPSPSTDPVAFLARHITELPPYLLASFNSSTTPKQRTVIPRIRNRRLLYTTSNPAPFSFTSARAAWPLLWTGTERRGTEEGEEERKWAQTGFLEGSKKHVGKLGNLLSGYEEEREAQRVRVMRRERASNDDENFIPEEDEDTDEEQEEELYRELAKKEAEDPKVERDAFERLVRERFIYGLLPDIDYDVDWDDKWDTDNDRDAEDRWFDDEED